jgi:TetR/AcrR family transcriptional repressor of nem operon
LPDAPARRRSYVEDYLSTASRDEAGSACTVAALAGDVAREPQDKLVRAAYLESAKAMTARLASLSPMDRDGADRRSRALAEMAMLVGAQMIARATRGDPMSQEILSSTRAYLLADAPANDEPSR